MNKFVNAHFLHNILGFYNPAHDQSIQFLLYLWPIPLDWLQAPKNISWTGKLVTFSCLESFAV